MFTVFTFALGIVGIAKTKKIGLALIYTYFISQPFSWTMLIIANGGGSVILPVPDLVGIYLFLTGVVEYEFSERYINACLPPSPISSLVVFVIVFFIARCFKRVAYHNLFRRKKVAAEPS